MLPVPIDVVVRLVLDGSRWEERQVYHNAGSMTIKLLNKTSLELWLRGGQLLMVSVKDGSS